MIFRIKSEVTDDVINITIMIEIAPYNSIPPSREIGNSRVLVLGELTIVVTEPTYWPPLSGYQKI